MFTGLGGGDGVFGVDDGGGGDGDDVDFFVFEHFCVVVVYGAVEVVFGCFAGCAFFGAAA